MFTLSNQKQKSRGFELQKPQKSPSLFQFVASIYSLRLRNEVLQQLGADLITRRSANWAKHCDTGSGTWVENASAWSCGGDSGPGQSHAPPLLQTSGFTPGAGWTCTKEILRGWTLVFPDTPSPPHQPTQWTFHGITKHCRIVLRISWCVFSFSSFKSEGDWDKRMGVVGAVVVAGLVNVMAAEVFCILCWIIFLHPCVEYFGFTPIINSTWNKKTCL